MAARALGLDSGPMSGIDKAKIDEAFFAGTRSRPTSSAASATATRQKLFARSPRLSFDEACRIE